MDSPLLHGRQMSVGCWRQHTIPHSHWHAPTSRPQALFPTLTLSKGLDRRPLRWVKKCPSPPLLPGSRWGWGPETLPLLYPITKPHNLPQVLPPPYPSYPSLCIPTATAETQASSSLLGLHKSCLTSFPDHSILTSAPAVLDHQTPSLQTLLTEARLKSFPETSGA